MLLTAVITVIVEESVLHIPASKIRPSLLLLSWEQVMNAAAAIAAFSHDGCLKGIRIKYAQECCGLRVNGEIVTSMAL